jgi:hypothetical protein
VQTERKSTAQLSFSSLCLPKFLFCVYFLDSGKVSSAIEWGIEPKLDNLKGLLDGNHALAHRQNIRVIVRPAQSRTSQVPGDGTSHAFDPVCDHRLAVARTAQKDASVVFARGDRLCYGSHNIGVIARLFGIRAEIVNSISLLDKPLFYPLFIFESCLVCANRYLHQ